ncbi:MAG: hypothetical protein V4495_26805 [Pseudomonadota bacterium]
MRAISFMMTVAFVLAGLPGLLISLYIAVAPTDQHRVLNGSRKAEIEDAKAYIQRFQERHAHMPTNQDFADWARFRRDLESIGFSYQTAPFSDELIKEFGKPPEGAYVFNFVLGGSFVYYPSWSKRLNSVYITDEQWWSHGSRWADVGYFSIAWLLPFFLAGLCMKLFRNEADTKPKKSA